MEIEKILRRFEQLEDREAVEYMARFGIRTRKAYGIKMPDLKAMAKEIGKDHSLALKLWAIDSRETRILATLVDDVKKLTEEQMEAWVKDFDCWEVCDQTIMNLFGPSPFVYKKALEWHDREAEFERRAAFVLIAWLGVHDKKADDARFEAFFPLIIEASTDERTMVMKGVNWALRQIGKRNLRLNAEAIRVAEKITKIDSKAARWIASDALRELRDEKVVGRLERKAKRKSL